MNMKGAVEVVPPSDGPLPPLQHPLDEAILGTIGSTESASLSIPDFMDGAEVRREQYEIASDDSISKRLMELCGMGVLKVEGENFRSIQRGPEFTLAEQAYSLAVGQAATKPSTQLVLIKHD